ncbi:hypothetical protein OKW37_002025 [Paraburkholderia sp. MM5482-R2]|uniref:hypothetical protein n=1 Tax=Paraburkholderia sp. MM5482-R2 TaxID=2991064 RepID=UPI003D1ED33C
MSSAESFQRKARLAQLPDGFDPKLYLEANPDVGAAGVDPVDHFVDFGRAEGRPLRP